MSEIQSEISEEPTIENFRENLDAIHQIFRQIGETNEKIYRLNFPSHILGLPLAAGMSYGANLLPLNNTFFSGMFIGYLVDRSRLKRKNRLKEQTIMHGRDISELIRHMTRAFIHYLKIHEIISQHPEIREQLTDEDYRKILAIDRISAQTDHRLRQEKREIDRNSEKALDFSQRRKEARDHLARTDTQGLFSYQEYLTKRSDQQELKQGDTDLEEQPGVSSTRTQESMRKILSAVYRRRIFTFNQEKREKIERARAFQETVPRLRTKYFVDALKATIAPEGREFQYPSTFRSRFRDQYYQRQIRNAQKIDTTDPKQQAMNLIKDIQKIINKQNRLDKRIALFSNIRVKQPNWGELGIAGGFIGGYTFGELSTSLRDFAIGLIPLQYNGLVGAIAGYGAINLIRGTYEKYADKKKSGKHLAARAVALWLMEEKLARFLKLMEKKPELKGELTREKRIQRAIQKIKTLAKQIDDRTVKELKEAEKESTEYNEQIEEAKTILKEKTDYGFLVPLLPNIGSNRRPILTRPVFTRYIANKNGVHNQKVKRFYSNIDEAKRERGNEPLLKSFQILSNKLNICADPIPDR